MLIVISYTDFIMADTTEPPRNKAHSLSRSEYLAKIYNDAFFPASQNFKDRTKENIKGLPPDILQFLSAYNTKIKPVTSIGAIAKNPAAMGAEKNFAKHTHYQSHGAMFFRGVAPKPGAERERNIALAEYFREDEGALSKMEPGYERALLNHEVGHAVAEIGKDIKNARQPETYTRPDTKGVYQKLYEMELRSLPERLAAYNKKHGLDGSAPDKKPWTLEHLSYLLPPSMLEPSKKDAPNERKEKAGEMFGDIAGTLLSAGIKIKSREMAQALFPRQAEYAQGMLNIIKAVHEKNLGAHQYRNAMKAGLLAHEAGEAAKLLQAKPMAQAGSAAGSDKKSNRLALAQ